MLKSFLTLVLIFVCSVSLCYVLSWLGFIPGILGLVGGGVAGLGLSHRFIRTAPWWQALLATATIILGCIAAILGGV